MRKDILFEKYYLRWIHMYKEGSVKPVTLDKYYLVHRELKKRLPKLRLKQMDHFVYQRLINEYAKDHEYLTVKDFHHHVKASLMDALDEGLLSRDPTRHLSLSGKQPSVKKAKFLNLLDLKRLLNQLSLTDSISIDWAILLIAKTGLRFAEALGITPADFNFQENTLRINKTWDYKSRVGKFQPTKNKSSIRTISIDPILAEQLQKLIAGMDPDKPIFVPEGRRIYDSTINSRLASYCKKAGIKVISVHGLRHTHASLLIFDGVSISSVAKRLGHSNTVTTQQTYLHIVKELEVRDDQKIMENMIRLS